MKTTFGLICLTASWWLSFNHTNAQNLTQEETYQVYSNLVGKWEAEGQWQGGTPYHQVRVIEKELTGQIFTVSTYDYTDSQAFDNAKRNYGIRAWDKEAQKMKFWEFDVFGGITTGEIKVEGNQIYYIYAYQSKSGATLFLADVWGYVDAATYTFKVCDYTDGKLGKEYLSTVFKRK